MNFFFFLSKYSIVYQQQDKNRDSNQCLSDGSPENIILFIFLVDSTVTPCVEKKTKLGSNPLVGDIIIVTGEVSNVFRYEVSLYLRLIQDSHCDASLYSIFLH